MSRKGKMSAAEKQRRRERREARRRGRVESRTDAEQERLDRTRSEMVHAGGQALQRLVDRGQKLHKKRMKRLA